MIEIRNISKKFKDNIVFSNLDFKLPLNKVNLITGDNGSGKTTLLRIISGSLFPDSGEIRYKGEFLDFGNYKYNKFSLVREPVGFYPQLSGISNLDFFLSLRDIKINYLELERYCDILRISRAELYKKAVELSGGNAFKLSLLKALMDESETILIDEGLKTIDYESFSRFKEYIKEELVKRKTFIIATHSIKDFIDLNNEYFQIENGALIKKC